MPQITVPKPEYNKYGKQTKKSQKERAVAIKWNRKKITYKEADRILTDIILDFSRSEIEEMQHIAKTLDNWKEEIKKWY